MDDYFVTFGSPGADTHIRNSRAIQCIGLIESYAPIPKRTKIKEATRHTLKCLWCAYRVTKHDCDVALQSIVHQSFFTRGQKMQVLLSQTKERKCMTAIVAN